MAYTVLLIYKSRKFKFSVCLMGGGGREMTKEHKVTLGDDGYVHYLDWGDSLTSI